MWACVLKKSRTHYKQRSAQAELNIYGVHVPTLDVHGERGRGGEGMCVWGEGMCVWGEGHWTCIIIDRQHCTSVQNGINLCTGSCEIPHDTCEIPHGSCEIPHDSCEMPHGSCEIPHDTCKIPHVFAVQENRQSGPKA